MKTKFLLTLSLLYCTQLIYGQWTDNGTFLSTNDFVSVVNNLGIWTSASGECNSFSSAPFGMMALNKKLYRC